MKRVPLLVLIVTVAVVVGVGGAMATTHGRATASAAAGAGGEAAAPTIQADGTPDQRAAKATVTLAAATTARQFAASSDEKDCWDDCGPAASGSAGSAGVDDDGDGDGGDCGEGD
jgi:hypothetical protein